MSVGKRDWPGRQHRIVGILDGGEHRFRVRGRRHGDGFFVDAVANVGEVAPQLLQQLDELGRLLFAQDAEFEGELLAVARDPYPRDAASPG